MNIDRLSAPVTQLTGRQKPTVKTPSMNTKDQVVLTGGKPDKQVEDMETLKKFSKPAIGSRDKKELTIMFYMNGEYEDIGSTIQQTLFELKRAGGDENVNILAQIGYTPKKPDKESLQTRYEVNRYVVTPDDKAQGDKYIKDRMNPDRVASLDSEASITKPEVLEDFIASGMKKFPANHYMLVFMGHGGGWKGAVDMTPDQMGKAVKSALTRVSDETGKDEKIDITLFNSCLMSNVEALDQMKETSDITIASEDVARGGIFSFWDEVLGEVKNDIKKGESFEAGKFARDFVELFRSFQAENQDASIGSVFENMFDKKKSKDTLDSFSKKFSYSTLTAIDNRKLKGVEDTFTDFVKTLRSEKIPPRRFFKSLSEAPNFQGFNDKIGGQYHYTANLRDLGHIMRIVKDARWSNLRVKKAAADVLKAIGDATINEQHEGKEGEYYGMTMYAPTNAGSVISDNEKYRENVGEFAEKTGWADYLMDSAGRTPEWAREQVKNVDLPTLVKLGHDAVGADSILKNDFITNNIEDYQKKYDAARKRELEHISSEPIDELDPYRFYQEEIMDWRSFMVSLKENRNPVEEKIMSMLDTRSRAYINNQDKNQPVSETAMKAVTKSLNELLESRELGKIAESMKKEGNTDLLRDKTLELLELGVDNLEPENLRILNRCFIQDLYPSGITSTFGEEPDAFHFDEIIDRHAFFGNILKPSSPAKEHLLKCLDDDSRKALDVYQKSGFIKDNSLKTMVTGLNRLLKSPAFPDREIFLKDTGMRRLMNDRTLNLLNRKPEDLSEKDLKYLNRSLLSCMFPAGVSYYRWNLEFHAKSSKEWQGKLDKYREESKGLEEFNMKLNLANTLAPYLDMTRKME